MPERQIILLILTLTLMSFQAFPAFSEDLNTPLMEELSPTPNSLTQNYAVSINTANIPACTSNLTDDLTVTKNIPSAEKGPKINEIIKKTLCTVKGYTHTFYQSNRKIAEKIFNSRKLLVSQSGKIPDGPVYEYFDNGALQYEWTYKKGLRNGCFTGYFENGVVKGEYNYQNDLLDGESREYYETGTLKITAFFKKGIQDGLFKSFNEQAVLTAEGFFQNGQKEGTFISYFPDGKIQYKDLYRRDKRLKRTAYNGSGEIIWSTNY